MQHNTYNLNLKKRNCKLPLRITGFVDNPCTTFFTLMRKRVNYVFDPSALFYPLRWVGVGFGSVYRRYGRTIPSIFGPLWSVSGTGNTNRAEAGKFVPMVLAVEREMLWSFSNITALQ
jgi:hypothetical protein